MNLLAIYRKHSKADRYLLGYIDRHEKRIYSAVFTLEQAEAFIVNDTTAANEQGEVFPCIRFKVGRKQRDLLEAGLLPNWERLTKVRLVCTEAELRDRARAMNKNLGEAFEVLACERLGLKRNTNLFQAWFNGPDAWDLDGTALQIGFEGKTFTYTAQVKRNNLSE